MKQEEVLQNISVSTLHSIIQNITIVTTSYLCPKFVKWSNQSELVDTEVILHNKKGFPGVIGIQIQSPQNFAENYVNLKGFYSLILQEVCGHNLKFIDCFVRWPGSVHDARVLEKSSLYETAGEKC